MNAVTRLQGIQQKEARAIRDDQNVLFIKLGQGGEWERGCLEEGTIRLGFVESDHDRCLNGDWDAIAAYYRENEKKTKIVATQFSEQIKKFYEEPTETIWFTFSSGFLWWCRAASEVKRVSDGTKVRRVIGKWSNHDANGNPIHLEALSGKLLQTRGFRGTICKPEAGEYLRRLLNGEKSPDVVRSLQATDALVEAITPVIQSLTPQDFELLVDLIFRQGGWQRAGVVGGTEKDIDLLLYSPVTKERIAIQVKSKSPANQFREYMERFSSMMPDFSRFFYVVHSGGEELAALPAPDKVSVICGKELGDLVVRAGLIDWVIKKAG